MQMDAQICKALNVQSVFATTHYLRQNCFFLQLIHRLFLPENQKILLG